MTNRYSQRRRERNNGRPRISSASEISPPEPHDPVNQATSMSATCSKFKRRTQNTDFIVRCYFYSEPFSVQLSAIHNDHRVVSNVSPHFHSDFMGFGHGSRFVTNFLSLILAVSLLISSHFINPLQSTNVSCAAIPQNERYPTHGSGLKLLFTFALV